MRERSTRATIVGLFGLTGERELTAGDLVRLAEPLGIGAANLKSHLTRMVADGSLRRRGATRRSRYSPRTQGRALSEDVSARVAAQAEPWNGRWITLAVRWPRSRGRRTTLRRALLAAGYCTSNGSSWLRPDWPAGPARRRAAELAPALRAVWTVGEAPTRAERDRIVALYRLEALDRRARAVLARPVLERPALERTTLERAVPGPARGRVAGSGSARAALAGRRRVAEELRALLREDPHLPRELWGRNSAFQELLARFASVDQRLARDSRAFVAAALRREPAPRNRARGSRRRAWTST